MKSEKTCPPMGDQENCYQDKFRKVIPIGIGTPQNGGRQAPELALKKNNFIVLFLM